MLLILLILAGCRHLVKMFDTFPQMLENMAHLGHLFNTDRLSYFIHTSTCHPHLLLWEIYGFLVYSKQLYAASGNRTDENHETELKQIAE